ncbi:MAG: DUF4270 domain-containing protein [Flavobacteriales bacterium]|nr:DUF4270 domain-containing protein [Flavobacteriales bacterium]
MPIKNSLKQLGLFSLLIALLVSCKKPDETLGENLQPESDRLYVLQTDSFDLSAENFKKERTRIDLFANFMTGNYVDDVFGTVRCEAVFQLAPSNTETAPSFKEIYRGSELILDSIVLQLAFQKESYGKNVPMYFSLNELMDAIHIDSTYYSDFVVHKKTENLIYPGREWQHPKPENISTSDSSLYFNIRLKDELGEEFLKYAPLGSFSTFRDYFHGFVLSSSTIDGRVLSLSASNTKLTLHYHTDADPAVLNEDANQTYDLVYTSSCESFTIVDHQHYGTVLSPLSYGNAVDGSEYCYAQHAASTRIKVDISDVLRLQNDPMITINKAELVVPYDYTSKYSPIDVLTLSYSNDGTNYLKTADSLYIGGAVNKTYGWYRFNITRHVQRILDGDITTTDLYLTDNPLTTIYNSTGVRRSLLHGPHFSSTDSHKNLRLLITYSY